MEIPEINLNELNEKALLLRIAQELGTIRKLVIDVVQYARGAEAEVPEFMRRFANYMHDLHDIKYMYESLGYPPPDYIMRELERCDDRMRQLLEKLKGAGGTFEKIMREMAADPNNRWDHTKLLPKQEKPNAE